MSLDRVVIAKEFESHRQSLIELVQGFDQSHDPLIGTGDRNVIKRMEFKGISVAVEVIQTPELDQSLGLSLLEKIKSRTLVYVCSKTSLDGHWNTNPGGFYGNAQSAGHR